MSINTSKAIKSISYNGQDMTLSSSGGAELVSFKVTLGGPVSSGWYIIIVNDSGAQVLTSRGTYTAYKNSLVYSTQPCAVANSSGISRIYNENESAIVGCYLITDNAVFSLGG